MRIIDTNAKPARPAVRNHGRFEVDCHQGPGHYVWSLRKYRQFGLRPEHEAVCRRWAREQPAEADVDAHLVWYHIDHVHKAQHLEGMVQLLADLRHLHQVRRLAVG